MSVCLDTWAVMRWLEDRNPPADHVTHALEGTAMMSWINLGEVYYVVRRWLDEARADDVVHSLRGRLTLELPDEERVLEAATIKSRYKVSYADAFAVATAIAHNIPLMTGDPEILDGGDPSWPTIDIRHELLAEHG